MSDQERVGGKEIFSFEVKLVIEFCVEEVFGVNDLSKIVWRRFMLKKMMRGSKFEFIGKGVCE
jgi:hypothetical protein